MSQPDKIGYYDDFDNSLGFSVKIKRTEFGIGNRDVQNEVLTLPTTTPTQSICEKPPPTPTTTPILPQFGGEIGVKLG